MFKKINGKLILEIITERLKLSKKISEMININSTKSFIRICGVSPLIDYNLIDKAISRVKVKKHDILTNIFTRSFKYPNEGCEWHAGNGFDDCSKLLFNN